MPKTKWWKHKVSSVLITKKVKRIDKNGEEVTKRYLTNLKLLIEQNLCHAHYQIFSISSLKEFIKSNANMQIIKNVKLVELSTKIVSAMTSYYTSVFVAIGITQTVCWKLRGDLLIHTNLRAMISIS